MNQYCIIMGCYSFDEKDKETGQLTGNKKYCIKCNQLFSNGSISSFTFNYYFTEDEFLEKFHQYIDPEKYSLGLEKKILQVKLVGTPVGIVEKVPEKKSN